MQTIDEHSFSRSSQSLQFQPIDEARHAATAGYDDIRRRHVLIQQDARDGALSALLRFDGAEVTDTRRALRELGFHPNASPAHAPVSYYRRISDEELGAMGARLHEALGDLAVLDVGATFTDVAHRPRERMARAVDWWPGRFVLHVGGTRRCVVFDSDASEAELSRLIVSAREEYYAHDFHPATE